jgi:adenylate kinase
MAISFIGGIHGVGKSTICQAICKQLEFTYLSASELIKWKDINTDKNNKLVDDIPDTQTRLIHGLQNAIKPNNNYLLDGHYCLLDKDSNIVKIPAQTFIQINPISLSLIIGDVTDIKQKLEDRDNRGYSYKLLQEMQQVEVAYAKELSNLLGVSLEIGSSANFSNIVSAITNSKA